MVRFAPFFFFFFEFRPKSGRFGRFGRYRQIPADTDRVGPIWVASAPISAASAPILAASARFGNRHVAQRGTDARSAASLPCRRVPPRWTRVRSPGSRVRASLEASCNLILMKEEESAFWTSRGTAWVACSQFIPRCLLASTALFALLVY